MRGSSVRSSTTRGQQRGCGYWNLVDGKQLKSHSMTDIEPSVADFYGLPTCPRSLMLPSFAPITGRRFIGGAAVMESSKVGSSKGFRSIGVSTPVEDRRSSNTFARPESSRTRRARHIGNRLFACATPASSVVSLFLPARRHPLWLVTARLQLCGCDRSFLFCFPPFSAVRRAPSLFQAFSPPCIFITGTVERQRTEDQQHFLAAHNSVTSHTGTAHLRGTPPTAVVPLRATPCCVAFR